MKASNILGIGYFIKNICLAGITCLLYTYLPQICQAINEEGCVENEVPAKIKQNIIL